MIVKKLLSCLLIRRPSCNTIHLIETRRRPQTHDRGPGRSGPVPQAAGRGLCKASKAVAALRLGLVLTRNQSFSSVVGHTRLMLACVGGCTRHSPCPWLSLDALDAGCHQWQFPHRSFRSVMMFPFVVSATGPPRGVSVDYVSVVDDKAAVGNAYMEMAVVF